MEPLLSTASVPATALRRTRQRWGAWLTLATLWRVLGYSGLLLFAVLLGLSAVFLPWYLYVGLVLAVAYPVLVFRAPWVAFAMYAIGVFLAPGYKSADGLTLVTMALFALRWLMAGRPALLPRALGRPYLLFLFAVAVAGVLGLVVYRYKLSMVYGDGRGFVYWLWLPLV